MILGFNMALDTTCLFTLTDSLRFIWELTHRCNESCIHCCANASARGDEELSTGQIKQAFGNLAERDWGSFYASGGEPMVREDFLELLQIASTHIPSRNINFATNGKAITPRFAKQVAGLNLGTALVSLDGYNPETAKLFRGPQTAYNDAVNAMRLLSEEGIRVRLGVVIWAGNYQHLEDFARIGYENGAHTVFFNWLMPVGRAGTNSNLQVSPSLYLPIAQEILDIKSQYSSRVEIGYHRFGLISANSGECQAGRRILHCLPDGTVTPCSWLYKADPTMASRKKLHEAPLDEILQEEPFCNVQRIIDQRRQKGVGPGCLAVCKLFTGSYMGYDPLYDGKGAWVR